MQQQQQQWLQGKDAAAVCLSNQAPAHVQAVKQGRPTRELCTSRLSMFAKIDVVSRKARSPQDL